MRIIAVMLIAFTLSAQAQAALPTPTDVHIGSPTPTPTHATSPALGFQVLPPGLEGGFGWGWLIYWGVSFVFSSILSHYFGDWLSFMDTVMSGRAKVGKDSATDDIALWAAASTNPKVVDFAASIRTMERMGEPISTGHLWARVEYAKIAYNLCDDMYDQFYTPTNPNSGLTLCVEYLNTALLPNPDSNLTAIHIRQSLDAKYTNAVRAGIINPFTGFPYRSQVLPKFCPQQWHMVGQNCRPCSYQPTTNQCPPRFN